MSAKSSLSAGRSEAIAALPMFGGGTASVRQAPAQVQLRRRKKRARLRARF
jgi:hypothetical protein